MLERTTRRKLAVRIVASPKATASAGSADDNAGADQADADASSAAATADAAAEALAGATADGTQGDSLGAALKDVPVEVIKDVWAFKRAQEMYPSPK